MPKHRISLEQHQAIGEELKKIRDSLCQIRKIVIDAYPKKSPEVGYFMGKHGLTEKLDSLRIDLENDCIAAGGDEFIYFGKKPE